MEQESLEYQDPTWHKNNHRTWQKPKEGPSSPSTTLKDIQKHVECRETTGHPEETPLELARRKNPGTLATEEGPKAVAPQLPAQLATQGLSGNLKDKKAPHEKQQKKGSSQKKTGHWVWT